MSNYGGIVSHVILLYKYMRVITRDPFEVLITLMVSRLYYSIIVLLYIQKYNSSSISKLVRGCGAVTAVV